MKPKKITNKQPAKKAAPSHGRLKSPATTPYQRVMSEVELLGLISKRLDLLASDFPPLTKELLPVSASILKLAIVLKVLVISKAEA